MFVRAAAQRYVTSARDCWVNGTRQLSGLATATKLPHSKPSNPENVDKRRTTEHEIYVEFHEHCKSGSDGEAADLKVNAYGKTTTKLEDEEMKVAEEESKKVSRCVR